MTELKQQEYEDLRRVALAVARDVGARDTALIADQVMERLVLAPEVVEYRTAWVRTVARRLAIDEHRAIERRGGPSYGWDAFAEGDEVRGPEWVPSPSAAVRRGLLVELLLETLSTRDANLLRDWADGWSAAEMGERYGLAPASVQVTLARLKARLRAVADRAAADLE